MSRRRRAATTTQGLGKTLQTIAFLAHLKFVRGLAGPSLVVCPLSVLSSWMVECKRFCPALRAVKLHSSDLAERERLKRSLRDPNRYDLVVTTYEMAKSPTMASCLAGGTWWRYVVLDEGHVLKNEGSEISRAVRRLHFGGALLLTGTPLQNDLHELWALLNFLHPELLPSSAAFDAAFRLEGGGGGGGSSSAQGGGAARGAGGKGGGKVDSAALRRAHELLRPLMLRRVKADVERQLPPKLETKILCPLSECQLFWYKRLLLRGSEALDELERQASAASGGGGGGGGAVATQAATGAWKRLQSLLMQLRKCCNHPYLFEVSLACRSRAASSRSLLF